LQFCATTDDYFVKISKARSWLGVTFTQRWSSFLAQIRCFTYMRKTERPSNWVHLYNIRASIITKWWHCGFCVIFYIHCNIWIQYLADTTVPNPIKRLTLYFYLSLPTTYISQTKTFSELFRPFPAFFKPFPTFSYPFRPFPAYSDLSDLSNLSDLFRPFPTFSDLPDLSDHFYDLLVFDLIDMS